MASVLRTLQRIGQSLPVLIILSIVFWSYYAFVVSLCGVVPSPELKTFYLIVYHIAFITFLLSYIRIIFSNPGSVPPQFYLTAVEKEGLDSSQDPRKYLEEVGHRLPIHETTLTNAVRYCEVCVCIKPDRAHHCSLCRRCILKMDHHCPWVNNCVGFRNYKFFTNFLLFSCIYCLITALFVAPWSIYIWNRVPELHHLPEMTRFNIMILFFVAGMFFISVLGLSVFHCYLTASNRSTLEMGRSPRFRDEAGLESGTRGGGGGGRRHAYDIGCRNNCTEVYGTGPCILCPVYTSRGNGVLYPRDRSERGSSDMRRLLGSHGDDDTEEEEIVVYNGDTPLNLQPLE